MERRETAALAHRVGIATEHFLNACADENKYKQTVGAETAVVTCTRHDVFAWRNCQIRAKLYIVAMQRRLEQSIILFVLLLPVQTGLPAVVVFYVKNNRQHRKFIIL